MTRTIRTAVEVDKSLQEIAEKERVTVNNLVDRLLRRYVDFEFRAERFGFVMVSEQAVKKTLSYLSEEQLSDLGVWSGKILVKELTRFWFKDFTIENFVKLINFLTLGYLPSFTAEYVRMHDFHVLMVQHRFGRAGSIVFGKMMEEAVGAFGQKAKVELSEGQIVAKF